MDTYKVFTELKTWIFTTDYFTYYQSFEGNIISIRYADTDGLIEFVIRTKPVGLYKLVNGEWINLL